MHRFLIIFMFYCSNLLTAQNNSVVWLNPNKGQWDSRVLYKVDLQMGEMLIEGDGFTYNLNDYNKLMSHDNEHHHEGKLIGDELVRKQVIKTKFINSGWKGKKTEKQESVFYRNYFLGNDPEKWKSKVKSYTSVVLEDFYSDIDLIIDGANSEMKYSFLVKRNAKASKIKYKIIGASNVKLQKDGSIAVRNRFGEIIDSEPIAWSVVDGEKVFVEVDFVLKDNLVSFTFPNGYDHFSELIIDPSISFSTFSGSTADNWGMTATPDNNGNLYAAGIVFNDGGEYPVTTGVFDEQINGGEVNPFVNYSTYGFDLAISKFNEDGSELLYATYLGGSGNETPHSLVVDENDNLYLLGATSSTNFPTLTNSFDVSFNGGFAELNNHLYFSASDLFISKLSSDGSQLLGSTYIGGSGNDGLNTGDLNYNFGDSFRGEIIHGEDGFVYVSSTTRSDDFPTYNFFQNELKGEQDAVVFKINDGLTSLSWSSYFGGDGEETGNSIQKSPGGDIYFTGGSTSSQVFNLNGYNGGLSDGYLIRLNSNSGNIINSTFVGGSGYDQIYFVQLDESNNVFVYGQTDTNWDITNGLYGTPNSGQFLRKFNASLSTVEWTTMIGAGTGFPEISPTAFLVSNCDEIYLAGWGGVLNRSNSAVHSTTEGFETTLDAFQSSTNGSNFYIAVLEKDALALKYATFMGGLNSSYNHVDGGTSRFDKKGKIYHAVCAACGGDENGFTSTSNAYSPTNQSNNCNLAAFKIELNSVEVDVTSISPQLCLNDPNVFYGVSSNGNSFYWDFGDGSFSSEQSPSHTYTQPGLFTVSLTISDTIACLTSKTREFEAEVLDLTVGVGFFDSVYCKGVDYEISAYGGENYLWTPSNLFSNPLDSVTNVNIQQDTTIEVKIENFCVQDSFVLNLYVSDLIPTISNDTTLCENQSVILNIDNSLSQIWSPSTYLDNPLSASPIATPNNSILYEVQIISNDGCVYYDSLKIEVSPQTINSIIPPDLKDTSICVGDIISIPIENTLWHQWSMSSAIDDTLSLNPNISVDSSTTIYITAQTIDFCYLMDSIVVEVLHEVPNPLVLDTVVNCFGDSTHLKFSGAEYYDFSMNISYNLIAKDTLSSLFIESNYFYCNFINSCGSYYDSLYINLISPKMQSSNDTMLCPGQNVLLWADSMKFYKWFDENTLISNSSSCTLFPESNSSYLLIGEDEYGCLDSSTVKVGIFPNPKLKLMDDYLAELDEEVKIEVYTNSVGSFEWSPGDHLSCIDCKEPFAIPNKEIVYSAFFTDSNGCKVKDSVRIYYDGILYVPNSFTPNVDGKFNTHFYAKGLNISEYQMLIFDRWGHLVFESKLLDEMWDGYSKGEKCQIGTYIWKVSYKDVTGNQKEIVGHVNLLR